VALSPALSIPRGARGLLVRGDNLALLAALRAGSVDLIVTDPPFFSGRTRSGAVPHHSAARSGAAPQRGRARTGAPARCSSLSFDDRWGTIGEYLAFLAPRLQRMRLLLKATGSLVVHLDYHAVHEVKLLMDGIFGRDRFVNEIIWHYTGGGRSKRYFSRKHDTLLWYARGRRWTFNLDAMRVPYHPRSGYARGGIVSRSGKRYLPHPEGTPVDDVWNIPIVNPLAGERCGYPAQKPERLLERVILALSRPGDLVLDPFCGSGTTAVCAARLGRRWIAGDISPRAVAIARRRLRRACGENGFREEILRPPRGGSGSAPRWRGGGEKRS